MTDTIITEDPTPAIVESPDDFIAQKVKSRREARAKGEAGEPLDIAEARAFHDSLARSFVTFSEAGRPDRSGVWVDVPLPTYKGLRVLFRTNNPSRVRRERPTYLEPAESVLAKRNMDALVQKLQNATPEELPALLDERAISLSTIERVTLGSLEEHHRKQSRWLAMYVIDFDGWPSKYPQPDPEEPDSYAVLHTELEDLYRWLCNEGYEAALQAAAKNS